jgi:hypothetical protein
MLYFSSGGAAEVSGFSQTTIRHQIEDGFLDGLTIPLSRHRRITLEQLGAWIHGNELPGETLERVRPVMAAVSKGEELAAALRTCQHGDFPLSLFGSPAEALSYCVNHNVRLLMVDCAGLKAEDERPLQSLRQLADRRGVGLVGLMEAGSEASVLGAHFHRCITPDRCEGEVADAIEREPLYISTGYVKAVLRGRPISGESSAA